MQMECPGWAGVVAGDMTLATPDDLLAALTCGDASRVWTASSAVIHWPRPEELRALAPALSLIRHDTQGLHLGGALISNSEHLRQALRTIEAVRDGRCRCTLYPNYLFYDPEREQQAGHIEILSSTPPDWTMTYQCRCLVCRRAYAVEQGEYHYTWWKWTQQADPVQ